MADMPRPRCAPDLVDSRADGRLVASDARRNEQPIIDALRPALDGRRGLILEIGSGTGQHAAAWAAAFPDLEWQPSDPFDEHLESIRAWVAHAGRRNLRAPIWLDGAETWPALDDLTGVISVNVIHICPWVVAKGIVRGAGAALPKDGVLVFYGPFKEGGRHTGEGNLRFDETLRAMDPAWGVRDLDDVSMLARESGFGVPEITHMPANNRLVVYRHV